MSRGRPSQADGGPRGITRLHNAPKRGRMKASANEQEREGAAEGGETARRRPKGLALTARGPQAPSSAREERQRGDAATDSGGYVRLPARGIVTRMGRDAAAAARGAALRRE